MDWPSAATPNIVVNGDGSRSFRDRNLAAGIVGSQPLSADFNVLWGELINIVKAGSLTPNGAVSTQVLAALHVIFGGAGSIGFFGHMLLPGNLLLQWGSFSFSGIPSYPASYWGSGGGPQNGTVSGTFPVAFPSTCYGVIASTADSGGTIEGSEMSVGVSSLSLTGFTARLSRASGADLTGTEPGTVFYIALGSGS